MKNTTVLITSALFILVIMSGGCATLGGKSDEEMVMDVATEWKEAIVAQDIERIVACYSEDYEGGRGEDKAGMREFMENAIDGGMLDQMEISIEEVQVTVDGETASASNIELSWSEGGITLNFTLAKEGKAWLLTGSEMSRD